MSKNSIVQKVLQLSGFPALNPVQKEALKVDLLKGKNLVVAAPTASGKTLIAELAALNVIKNNKKVVYIVPLKALASEKYEEFKSKYNKLGIKVAISVGDLDSNDPWLANYDLIIVTSEKFDSLLRHGIDWVEQVGLIVADEIHLLDDPERGPTLEIILTRLRQITNPEILALSATINNYRELAEWLKATPIKSDYRPVKLYRGIYFNKKISWQPKKEQVKIPSRYTPTLTIASQTVTKGKQALIFVSTRKRTEGLAEKIGKVIKDRIGRNEQRILLETSKKILNALEHPTKQCEKLADCIKNSVAFHHAGLIAKQRKLIEDNFRKGIIKIIVATPTLAFGVNLPAFRVVIRDLKRFSAFRGMGYIPVLEIQQYMGRAGRPTYDTSGEAILIAKNKSEAKFIWEHYIKGKPENIVSKLGVEPVLRMHVLALIASEVTDTKKSLIDFFSKTFYAFQYKDLTSLEKILERVLLLLEKFKFIKIGKSVHEEFRTAAAILNQEKEKLQATRIGKRVAELYIDPLTANYLIQSLQGMEKKKFSDFSILQIISSCLEMRPLLNLHRTDFERINELIADQEENLIQKPPRPWDLEYDDFLRSIKTTYMFKEWAEEAGEDLLLEKFGITPGELRVRLEIADWLLYAMQELGLLLGFMDILKDIRKVRIRVQYGIREELLPLIRLRNVGRVRARLLFNSNIRTIANLKKVPIETLTRIIGPKIAYEVKKQLGQEVEKPKEIKQKSLEFE